MANRKVRSGADYATTLIGIIKKTELSLPRDERMDPELYKLWCEEIELMADRTWMGYIVGSRDSYRFTEKELREAHQHAVTKFTNILVESLLDKDMLKITAVNKDGNLLYGLTEKGQEHLNNK